MVAAKRNFRQLFTLARTNRIISIPQLHTHTDTHIYIPINLRITYKCIYGKFNYIHTCGAGMIAVK